MIEVFNSNNVDVISNAKANEFAIEHNMTKVSGSDSHVNSTLGRCLNVIESENILDDILFAMKHNKIQILNTGYTLPKETLDHIKYKINNSKEYIFEYIRRTSSKLCVAVFSLLLKLYNLDQDSYLWTYVLQILFIFFEKNFQ